MSPLPFAAWSLALACLAASVTLRKHYPKLPMPLLALSIVLALLGVVLLFFPTNVPGSVNISGNNSGNACASGATCTQGPPPPKWHVVHANPTIANADGTFTQSELIEIDSSAPQKNVVFEVAGSAIKDIYVSGVGLGPAIQISRGRFPDGVFFDAFSLPTDGQWNIGAITTDSTSPISISVFFNLPTR